MRGVLTVREIVEAVAERYDVSPSRLIGGDRTRDIYRPRNVCFFMARKFTGLSYAQIGRHFSNRHHRTIRDGEQWAKGRTEKDTLFFAKMEDLECELSEKVAVGTRFNVRPNPPFRSYRAALARMAA